MKQSKTPADPNRRAKATVDAIDAILDHWPESVPQEKDPERVARGKLGGAKGGTIRAAKLSMVPDLSSRRDTPLEYKSPDSFRAE